MDFLNKKSQLEVDLFLNRLTEKSIPNLSKLPIGEEVCKKGLLCAFESVVESGLHQYISNEQQQQQIKAVAHWLVSHEQKWGLLLNGIPGNGKTTTLFAIRKVINALELEDPYPISENKVLGFWIRTAKELCDVAIKDKKAFEQYKRCALLGIDEFGLEPTVVSSYGNEYTPIIDLLSYRYETRLATILTTNVRNVDIRPKYGDRIADRMNEMCDIIVMPDIDFRLGGNSAAFLDKLRKQ